MRSALGKGLSALISEDTAASVAAAPRQPSVSTIPIDKISSNPKQPRRRFAPEALAELASSIKQRGVLQPILLNAMPDGRYEIIAGERRWRAAALAGLTEVPAVVRTASETDRFQMALIENVQREDLNPIEQAQAYRRLQDEYQMTQEAISTAIGKDRAVIANTLRLLTLPEEIQQALIDGALSAGHGRALAGIEDAAERLLLFRRITQESLPVRAVEQFVRDHKRAPARQRGPAVPPPSKAPEIKAIEEELQRSLGRKVDLQAGGPAATKGWLRLEFYSVEDLERLVDQLRRVVPANP